MRTGDTPETVRMRNDRILCMRIAQFLFILGGVIAEPGSIDSQRGIQPIDRINRSFTFIELLPSTYCRVTYCSMPSVIIAAFAARNETLPWLSRQKIGENITAKAKRTQSLVAIADLSAGGNRRRGQSSDSISIGRTEEKASLVPSSSRRGDA